MARFLGLMGAALVALLGAGSARATVAPGEAAARFRGPLRMPLGSGYDRRVISWPDQDPAEGSAADWTGWIGTTFVPGQALDGNLGTDFNIAEGLDVYAATEGVVTRLVVDAPEGDPVGNLVEITWVQVDDAGGSPVVWMTTYSPLGGSISVEQGEVVEAGEVIATTAGADSTLGPHLHFEVAVDGAWADPWFEGLFDSAFLALDALYLEGEATLVDTGSGSGTVLQDLEEGDEFLSTLHSDGWHRLWRTRGWGDLVEARNERGGAGDPDAYRESGDGWADSLGGSQADGAVGIGFRGTGGTGSASFWPDLPVEDVYDVFMSWGAGASVLDVPISVHHADGIEEVQVSMIGGGLGTGEDPRIVRGSPYQDDGDSSQVSGFYSGDHPECAAGLDLTGPEVVYRLDTATSGDLRVTLTADPDASLQLVVLSSLSEGACLGSDPTAVELFGVPSGTVWIAVESIPDDAGVWAPGAYHLQVETSAEPAGDSAGAAANGNTWTRLGRFQFPEGRDPDRASVEVHADPGLSDAGNALRVAADAVWFLRVEPSYQAWVQEGDDVTVFHSMKGRGLVGTGGAAFVPAHEDPDAESPVRVRIPAGQRFYSDVQLDGWYRLALPDLREQPWVRQGFLVVYHEPGEEDDDPPVDDDLVDAAQDLAGACSCTSGSNPRTLPPVLALALALGWAVRRSRV